MKREEMQERLKHPVENMISYLKTMGHLTFEDRPFCEADALILSQLSYMQFPGFVPPPEKNQRNVGLLDFYDYYDKDEYYQDIHHAKKNREYYQALLVSDRFRNTRANYYVNKIGKVEESQFCAITFFLENGLVYVAFRGTDDNIIGWKEDFNMAFLAPVPAQKKAMQYLNEIGKMIPGPLMVGGHSKGGNLAVYAAMRCDPTIQKRITAIYSHDGPGFRMETFKTAEYDVIKSRIHKIVPHSSVIGMLLEEHEDYQTIASYQVGVLQHDPYSWIIHNGEFVYEKDLNERRKKQNKILNEWITSLQEEERQIFVDNLFGIFLAAEKDTITEWTDDLKNSILAASECVKEMDESQRKMMQCMVKRLRWMRRGKRI